MGLGISAFDHSNNESLENFRKVYQSIIDTITNEQFHKEVKKHLINEQLNLIKHLAIPETLICEIYPDNTNMVIIAGVYGPLNNKNEFHEEKDVFLYIKLKAFGQKVDNVIKTIQVNHSKDEDAEISKMTEPLNVGENYSAKKGRRKKDRVRKID